MAAGGWMIMPQGIANCPRGLEYLTMMDQLLVHKNIELVEELTEFGTENKFTIKNSAGLKVYFAVEGNGRWTRTFCDFRDLKILDNHKNEVIHLHIPSACGCFPCCLPRVEVSAPPGTMLGIVEQEWGIFRDSFTVKNASGDTALRIESAGCTILTCKDVELKVMSSDGRVQVGKILNQWADPLTETITNADDFGTTFPMNLDVRMKAVMLGACFLYMVLYGYPRRQALYGVGVGATVGAGAGVAIAAAFGN